jgi:hypothetical protein
MQIGPMRPAELALFAPLTVGSRLGPATITGFQSGDGNLIVNVTFGSTPQIFRVARTGPFTATSHLRATGPFTVYLVGSGTGSNQAEIAQAWHALEAVLARHTSDHVPENLNPCCPFNGSRA